MHKPRMNRRQLIQGGLCSASLLRMPAMWARTPGSEGVSGGLQINASRVPLSRLGSYLAVGFRFWDFGLSDQVTPGAYYIRCLQDEPSPPEVFRIEMLLGDSPGRYRKTSTCLDQRGAI